MRKLVIYEAVDDWDDEGELEDLEKSLQVLSGQNIEWERHDLDKDPAAFDANPEVARFMKAFGAGRLPLVQVDGVTVFAGHYPEDYELIDWLELPPEVLGYDWADIDEDEEDEHEHEEGCDCGCGHHHHH